MCDDKGKKMLILKGNFFFRTMQKQLKQLSDWLKEAEAKGHGSDDEVMVNAKLEVNEVISYCSTSITKCSNFGRFFNKKCLKYFINLNIFDRFNVSADLM